VIPRKRTSLGTEPKHAPVSAQKVTAVSRAGPGSGLSRLLLLVAAALGASFLVAAAVVPGSAVRFTATGRFVRQHQIDLAVIGAAICVTLPFLYFIVVK
jgi:uncharacterized protein HemX